MGKYNNLYRERAARIIEVPYYSVSLQCLQVFPKKVMGFTQGVAAKASAVGFCLGCGLFGSYNSL